eukprot:3470277-Pleurochrysis_carterae.AAC.1
MDMSRARTSASIAVVTGAGRLRGGRASRCRRAHTSEGIKVRVRGIVVDFGVTSVARRLGVIRRRIEKCLDRRVDRIDVVARVKWVVWVRRLADATRTHSPSTLLGEVHDSIVEQSGGECGSDAGERLNIRFVGVGRRHSARFSIGSVQAKRAAGGIQRERYFAAVLHEECAERRVRYRRFIRV